MNFDMSKREPDGSMPLSEWRYKSIVYTLFVASLYSATLINHLDKLDVPFAYADAKLILRAMFERWLTQSYILTDPERLGYLFALWGQIEEKRYHSAWNKISMVNDESPALQMQQFWNGMDWSEQEETHYQLAVKEWEAAVTPKQKADTARSWAGISLAKMADACGLGEHYQVFYRNASWFAHGLTFVSDMFINVNERAENLYEASYKYAPTEEQKLECYWQTYRLLRYALGTTNDTLEWGLTEKLRAIDESEGSALLALAHVLWDHFSPL